MLGNAGYEKDVAWCDNMKENEAGARLTKKNVISFLQSSSGSEVELTRLNEDK